MEEVEATGEKLRSELFMVANLEGQHFMDSKGKAKSVTFGSPLLVVSVQVCDGVKLHGCQFQLFEFGKL
jgi:hypothetical protein